MIFVAMTAFLLFGFGIYLEALWLSAIAGITLLIDGLLVLTATIGGVSAYFLNGLGITLCMAGILITLFSVLGNWGSID